MQPPRFRRRVRRGRAAGAPATRPVGASTRSGAARPRLRGRATRTARIRRASAARPGAARAGGTRRAARATAAAEAPPPRAQARSGAGSAGPLGGNGNRGRVTEARIARRQELERVDVAGRVVDRDGSRGGGRRCRAPPRRFGRGRRCARPRRPPAPGDLDRAEVQQRRGEPVGRLERDRAPVLRQRAGEASRRRPQERRRARPPPRRCRRRGADRRRIHVAPSSNGRRTSPEAGQLQARATGQSANAAARATAVDDSAFVAQRENTESTLAGASAVVKIDYSEWR